MVRPAPLGPITSPCSWSGGTPDLSSRAWFRLISAPRLFAAKPAIVLNLFLTDAIQCPAVRKAYGTIRNLQQ